jgi:hypothetical protein
VRPDPAAELEPIDPGKHHVEHDQRRWFALEQTLSLIAARRFDGSEAVALEVPHDHVAHDRLVVNHEHVGSGGGGHHRQGTNAYAILQHEFSFS